MDRTNYSKFKWQWRLRKDRKGRKNIVPCEWNVGLKSTTKTAHLQQNIYNIDHLPLHTENTEMIWNSCFFKKDRHCHIKSRIVATAPANGKDYSRDQRMTDGGSVGNFGE